MRRDNEPTPKSEIKDGRNARRSESLAFGAIFVRTKISLNMGPFFLVLFSRYYYLYLGMSFLLTAGTTDDDAFSGVTLVYRTKEREKRFFFFFL